MMARRTDSKLVALRKKAQQWAKRRKETLSSAHLLAAVCETENPARSLLLARRLDEQLLAKAARSIDEGVAGPVDEAFKAARELARRAAVPARDAYLAKRGSRPAAAAEPDALHVFVALLSNRKFAAYRVLDQHGVDIARLRNAARSIALGMVAPPRRVERTSRVSEQRVARPQPHGSNNTTPALDPSRRRRGGKAVPVPLIPPLERVTAGSRRRGITTTGAAATAPARKVAPKVPPHPSAPTAVAAPSAAVAAPSAVCSAGASISPQHTAATPALVPREAPPPPASGPRPSVKADVPATRRDDDAAAAGSLVTLDDEQLSVLAKAGTNLTLAAARGELEPVVGRDSEIEQVLDTLAKRRANAAFLVGPAGVGKSSIIRGVAQSFARDRQQPRLLVEVTVSELLSVTSGEGSMSIAERMANICREVAAAQGKVVLVIDDLPQLLASSLGNEAVLELKLALARGGLPLIAAGTARDVRQLIDNDNVLSRRLSIIEVEPPDETEAFLWLRAVCSGLRAHHDVVYSDDAISSAVSWSVRYMPARALPDKALSLLDLAGARASRRRSEGRTEVTSEHIAQVVSEAVDVPYERLLETDHQRMLRLAELLGQRVVGHQQACDRIAAVLRRNAAGLSGERPIGSLLLLGPTGVGKTETAKAIAELLFDSREAMIRLDMSEYSEAHAVARLVGAPPGYVGHDAGGVLTEALRRRPYQVVLLDEIEKAHRDVLQTFLQVFDEGRLTDGRGKTVDFRQTVIVLTSNLGAAEMGDSMQRREVGFGRDKRTSSGALEGVAIAAARRALPPELYNRIDEVIFYHPLSRMDVRHIAERLLSEVGDKLALRNVRLQLDDAALDALLDSGGYDPELGARPMRRAVARWVEGPIADLILAGQLPAGTSALVGALDGKVVVAAKQQARRAG